MLTRLQQAGVLSEKTVADILKKNDFYAPFNVIPSVQRANDALKSVYHLGNIIKQIKGINPKVKELNFAAVDALKQLYDKKEITDAEYYSASVDALDNAFSAGEITKEKYNELIDTLSDAGFKMGNVLDRFVNMIYDSHRIATKNGNMLRLDALAAVDADGLFAVASTTRKGMEEKPSVPEGWDAVPYKKDGKKMYLIVNKGAAKALMSMNPAEIDLFKRAFNFINKGIRFGAITFSSAFQATNFFLDTLRTATVSKYGIFAGKNGKDILANTVLFPFQYAEAMAVALYENIGQPALKGIGVNVGHTKLYESFRQSKGYSAGYYENPFVDDKERLKVADPSVWRRTKAVAGGLLSTVERIGRSLEQTHKLAAFERGMDIEAGKRMGLARLKGRINAAKNPTDLIGALDSVAYEVQNMAGSPNFAAASTPMKTLSLFFQFFSARVKGQMTDLRRMANIFTGAGEGVKLTKAQRGTLIAQFVAMAIPIFLNALNNYADDDDAEEMEKGVSEFDRNKNILIKMGRFTAKGVERPDYLKMTVWEIPAFIKHAYIGILKYIKQHDPKAFTLMAKKMAGEISPLDLEFEPRYNKGDRIPHGVFLESVAAGTTPFIKWPIEAMWERNTRYHSDWYKSGERKNYVQETENADGSIKVGLQDLRRPSTPEWAVTLSRELEKLGFSFTPTQIDHFENTMFGNAIDNQLNLAAGRTFKERFLRSESKYPVAFTEQTAPATREEQKELKTKKKKN
jgi:hypothetical protein